MTCLAKPVLYLNSRERTLGYLWGEREFFYQESRKTRGLLHPNYRIGFRPVAPSNAALVSEYWLCKVESWKLCKQSILVKAARLPGTTSIAKTEENLRALCGVPEL